VLLFLALPFTACAIQMEGKARASMFKRDAVEGQRAAANHVILARVLLEAGVSAAEARRQIELGGATADEAERIVTAASALCRCGSVGSTFEVPSK
jgi:hypothetical protein